MKQFIVSETVMTVYVWYNNVLPYYIVSNSEGSEILLYWEANWLACHSFMDSGKLYELPGSENIVNYKQ